MKNMYPSVDRRLDTKNFILGIVKTFSYAFIWRFFLRHRNRNENEKKAKNKLFFSFKYEIYPLFERGLFKLYICDFHFSIRMRKFYLKICKMFTHCDFVFFNAAKEC